MGRRRKGRKVDGWLNIDKPAGLTSAAVVNRVKKLFDAAKAGHGGTLDPLATGVLPIAFGEATKTSSFAMEGMKTYVFTIRWGVQTDTDDREGAEMCENSARPAEEEILLKLPKFTGEICQTPPKYSAIKIDGERAYDLARAGGSPEMPERRVFVAAFRLLEQPDDNHASFEVECGKGTYIRALARDLAIALGTVGHISALRRTKVANFGENNAISLDELCAIGQIAALEQKLLPVAAALDDIPALTLTEAEAMRMRNGQPVSLLRKADIQRIAAFGDGETVLARERDRPVALARYSAGEVRPIRVLNL